MTEAAREMLDFIAASPTPFHCVAEARRRVEPVALGAGQTWIGRMAALPPA